jgi:hypothetical protein
MKASKLCGVVADIGTHLVLGGLPGPPNAMGKQRKLGGVGACTCNQYMRGLYYCTSFVCLQGNTTALDGEPDHP